MGAGPRRLKEEVRIIAVTNESPAAVATDYTTPKENRTHWDLFWKGWDGLHIEMSHRSLLGDSLADTRASWQFTNAVLHLEQVKMTAKIGARIAVDAAGFVTTGDLNGFDSGAELRRLRIYAKGDCVLLLPVSYQIDLGYIPNQFYIEESYIAFRDLGFLGTLKIGQYRTPFSLDAYTSSRDIPLMEPAAPVTALSPGVNAGFQFGNSVFSDRMTWALGFFAAGAAADSGDASQDYGRSILRVTGLPLSEGDPKDPASQRLLHLGLSLNWLYSASSSVRYRTRPESHLAPYVLDTGELDAENAATLDFEAAYIRGPLSLQGELLVSGVRDALAGNPIFYGFYGQVGWFLTGESRPYNPREGKFARLVPRQDFAWHGGGWGAWEVLGRVSHTDLNDQAVVGGRMTLVTAGLNWHLNPHVRWAFNFITGKVDGPSTSGWMNAFQTRMELDF